MASDGLSCAAGKPSPRIKEMHLAIRLMQRQVNGSSGKCGCAQGGDKKARLKERGQLGRAVIRLCKADRSEHLGDAVLFSSNA